MKATLRRSTDSLHGKYHTHYYVKSRWPFLDFALLLSFLFFDILSSVHPIYCPLLQLRRFIHNTFLLFHLAAEHFLLWCQVVGRDRRCTVLWGRTPAGHPHGASLTAGHPHGASLTRSLPGPLQPWPCLLYPFICDERLSGFHILTGVNCAMETLRCLYFFTLDFPLDICPWVGPLCFQFLKEPTYCFPQWLYQFTFPPTVEQGSFSSTPSPAFVIRRLWFSSCWETCRISLLWPGINPCSLQWKRTALTTVSTFAFDVLGFSEVSVHLPRSHCFPKHWPLSLVLWNCFYYFLFLLFLVTAS